MVGTETGWRVVVTRRVPKVGMDILRAVRPAMELDIWDSDDPMPHDLLVKAVSAGVDAIYCVLSDKIDANLIAHGAPRLKCISTMSVGFNHIDIQAAKAAGIKVGFTPEVLTETVADLAVGITLATCRRFKEASAAVTNGNWGTWQPLWMCGVDVHHSTIGIFGLGRIGFAVAKRLRAFDCKIIYTDRYENPHAGQLDATRVPLEQLLAESDIIIPFCPSLPETHEMFNAELFGKMKKTAVFINVARGDIVQQQDLIEALKSNTIYGAGLDVTTPEPLPIDSELNSLPNCFIVPHIASATAQTRGDMAALASKNLIAAFEGCPLPKEVK
jgi:glyoxylate/hydroxypyruvate reductase